MRRGVLAFAFLCAFAATSSGCAKHGAPMPAAGAASDGDGGDASARADALSSSSSAADQADVALAGPWTEAIRKQRWADADRLLRALPEAERRKPEVRFALGRVALALGKHAEAIARLEKLEDELPLLRDPIFKARADAARVAGPFDVAAAWYAGRAAPSAWMTAAEAWDKAGEPARARAECDRVIASDKRPRALEERARALRMRIVRTKDGAPAAASDARWLAIHALQDDTAMAARELLDNLPAPAPLRADELIVRSRALADVGRSDDALRAVERAERAPPSSNGKNPSRMDFCRTRAEAYYKARTRYPEAALAYRGCASEGGPTAAENLFLSARAFSRADRDADALPGFASVIQRHPKTTWAEQAEFHIARTHALAGKWLEAAPLFDAYVKHFPNGHDIREAQRYRAIAHLVAHHDRLARKLLEDLAGGPDDFVTQARWINLAAIAALRDGDRTHALARWAEVARTRPLTWPALVARAHISKEGGTPPPAIDPAPPGEPPPPLVVELPPPVDVLHRIGFDADADEALREREGLVIAKSQGRGTEALCIAYARLDRAKRRFQISRQIPEKLLATAPSPQNRWAWECTYPQPHEAAVRESETKAQLPPNLVWAVMRQESAFDEEIVSPARAVGLLQLMPDTARGVANSARLPHEEAWLVRAEHNIDLGALYMHNLLGKFAGNVALASGAYNAGPEAITRWRARAKGQNLDLFVETIPFLETRGYVVRVMGNLARYGYMNGGDAGLPVIGLDLD